MAAGCTPGLPSPLPTPAPQPAWVRLEALLPPLPRFAMVSVLELPDRDIVWPSLLEATSLPRTAAWVRTQQRRQAGREALRAADAEGINALAARLKARQARLLEIRRVQFEGEERLRVASEMAEDKEKQVREIEAQLLALQDDLALARAQYEISRALASRENDALFVPNDPVLIEAEVRKLKEANLRAEIQVDAITGVRRAHVLWPGERLPKNARVLYAASRDALKDLCDRLDGQLKQVETRTETERQQRAQEREQEIQRNVAQRLEGILSQNESLTLRLDQDGNLSKILLAEELPSRRASTPVSPPKSTGTPLALPRAARPPHLRLTGDLSPQERIARRAELQAAVLDEAQKRGIRVRFTPEPGVPDRTVEFANWIKVTLP